ncbi:hypothetical protein H0H92_010250 [Tricholoma furcatifolium]|nr:hypothetical protein H0H92_010250 [Tricholoma furcatifolium]
MLPSLTSRRDHTSNISDITLIINKKSELLGVSDRTQLQKLITNPFYAARLNTIALKTHLQDRLRSRKFEMEHVECSFRKQVNNQKLDEHTASSVQRRDPTISRLATNYNHLVETMIQLIKDRKAPSHAICPEKIVTKGLYALDVDDAIRQDAGLNEDDDPAAPPPWLANESMCEGIKAVLEYDRCLEEKAQLQHECRSMCIWFAEEWKTSNLAIDTGLDFGDLVTLPEWGPSPEELLQARVAQIVMSVTQATPSNGDDVEGEVDDTSESDESDGEESGLADLLNALDIAHAYKLDNFDDNL